MFSSTCNVSAIREKLIRLRAHPAAQEAFSWFIRNDAEISSLLIKLCEVPAPVFQERARAEFVKSLFQALKLDSVSIDREGNVRGDRPGIRSDSWVVLSAHLDTVFPAATDVRVRREGGRFYAPGISDNSCGLSALVAIGQALQAAHILTESSIIFLATVGEEGEGNLRGIREFFAATEHRERTIAFISLDGAGIERITRCGLGSKRFRVTLRGPGGHSWSDYGTVNPVHAIACAVAALTREPPPLVPKSSINVGKIRGGDSVNAIPQSASIDVDFRSTSTDGLARLVSSLEKSVAEAVRAENTRAAASGTELASEFLRIGDRPSGETDAGSALVQTATVASQMLGISPILDQASTDSNIPMSLGIPAITIGGGGNSGNIHSLDEWYDPTGRETGLERALLIVLGMAGLAT